MDYKKDFSNLVHRIESTRRKETALMILSGTIKVFSIFCATLLIVSLIETFARGNEVFRAILGAMVLAVALVFFVLFVSPAILRALGLKNTVSRDRIALRVGEVYPDIKDRLCNVMQLISGAENTKGTSPQLAYAAFGNVAVAAKEKDFDAIIDKRGLKRTGLLFLVMAIVTVMFFGLFQSTLGDSLVRIWNWNKSYLPPAPFSLEIMPKSCSMLRGQKLQIIVNASGKVPDFVLLHIREEQQENYDEYRLRLDSGNVFKYEIPSLRGSLVFYAESPWLSSFVKTEESKILVIDRPLIRSLNGNLNFPSYTKLSPKTFDEQSADFSALKGTQVDLNILSNKELSEASIVIETGNIQIGDSSVQTAKVDTFKIRMMTDGRKAYGKFPVLRSCQYYVSVKDRDGQENVEPVKYQVIATSDEYPVINLISPTSDATVNEEAVLPIKVSISDDYGFTALKLNYRLSESKYAQPAQQFTSINMPLLGGETAAEIPYFWNLAAIGMSPEDKYEYYLEVFDNDRVSGPKSSKTRIQSVRLPSLEEVLKTADNDQKNIEKDLENLLKKTEDLKKDMDELNRDLQKNPKQKELDWNKQKKAEDIMKKQADIQNKMSDIQKNIQDVTQNLQENKALSPETLEKYQELQNLMKEVNSPELQRLQEKMKQALEKMSPEELQKAMKNVKFDEEQFKKNIERTMKILKRLQAEQKADALAKRAEELAKKQQDIQDQMNKTNPKDSQKMNELAKQQNDLQKDLANIQKELKDLENLMKEIGKDMPMSELQKANDDLNPSETNQMMQQSEEGMKAGDHQKSNKAQNKAKQNLKNFAQSMKDLKNAMNDNVTKETMRKLEKQISNLMELSKKQEELKNKAKSMDANSTQFPNLTEQQSEMSDALNNVANSMMEMSEKSFAITPEMAKNVGSAMQEMQQAMQSMNSRKINDALQSQMSAMGAMNSAAMEMAAMLGNMQSSGSCSNPGGSNPGGQQGTGNSMMNTMQQLAAQQQGMSQSMQQMANGGKLSMEQQAQLGRMAKEQGSAQKSIEDLAKEQKEYGGDKKVQGDLDKISKDMQEVVTDMKSGRITPETMKRQERILSRLLDATRSMNDRDYEKNRESKPGENQSKASPKDIDPMTQEGRTRAFQEMLKSIQQGYTKDYENLIRLYFEGLQNGSPQ